MVPLSAKAKGKQRAVEPFDEEQHEQESARELTIRFTEGIPDLVVQVKKTDAVRDVKRTIRAARSQLQNRRIRLIHSGRLLTDGTLLHSLLSTLERRQKRAVATDLDGEEEQPVSVTTWLHCSVGPTIDSGADHDGDSVQTAQLQPVRGFDRLASMGFSESDIANFRRQFHSQSSSNYLDTEFETEAEYDEHARALEEQWIDSLDNAGTATLSQSSSSGSSVLQGIVVGFFFPILPFFFMRKPRPAAFWEDGSELESPGTVIFSKRMQMGLVVGFLVNLLFGLWRYLLDSS